MTSERMGRQSIRLQGYDYSSAGYYFITIRTAFGLPALSQIDETGVILTKLGAMAQAVWDSVSARFPSCSTDVFTAQPDHVHCIIVIYPHERRTPRADDDVKRATLSEIVRAFKSLSALAINRHLERSVRPVWQRGFYERVIRNEGELLKAREYVTFNELKTAYRAR